MNHVRQELLFSRTIRGIFRLRKNHDGIDQEVPAYLFDLEAPSVQRLGINACHCSACPLGSAIQQHRLAGVLGSADVLINPRLQVLVLNRGQRAVDGIDAGRTNAVPLDACLLFLDRHGQADRLASDLHSLKTHPRVPRRAANVPDCLRREVLNAAVLGSHVVRETEVVVALHRHAARLKGDQLHDPRSVRTVHERIVIAAQVEVE